MFADAIITANALGDLIQSIAGAISENIPIVLGVFAIVFGINLVTYLLTNAAHGTISTRPPRPRTIDDIEIRQKRLIAAADREIKRARRLRSEI